MSNPSPEPTEVAFDVAAATVLLQSYDEYLQWLDRTLGAASEVAAAGHGAGAPLASTAGVAAQTGQTAQATAEPRFALPTPAGQRFRVFDTAPEMVVLPAGAVDMGAHESDPDAQADERPRRHIRLARRFAIGVAPITFEQWDTCLADDGTRHRPSDATWGRGSRPVMNVSWHDAEEYCGWLSRKTGLRWRLPSEAEWEFAFWAGQPQAARYPWGADLGFRQLRHHAWFSDNSDLRTQPVGQLQPNALGLVDMLGNTAEWVADAHHPDLCRVPADGSPYTSNPRLDSRVFKGGSWLERARTVRPSARDHFHPDHRSYRVGFRVVVELPDAD